jgi:hypothetical protein
MIPKDHRGEPISYIPEREFIYFKVRFNNFRDVSNSTLNEITDREETREETVIVFGDAVLAGDHKGIKKGEEGEFLLEVVKGA